LASKKKKKYLKLDGGVIGGLSWFKPRKTKKRGGGKRGTHKTARPRKRK